MSGQHAGGPARRPFRRRPERQPAGPDQAAGPDYPADSQQAGTDSGPGRHREPAASPPAAPGIPLLAVQTRPPGIPEADDIAAARLILNDVPGSLRYVTLGEVARLWDQLLWAACVLDAALRCEIAAPSAPPEMIP